MNVYIVHRYDYKGLLEKTTAWSTLEKAEAFINADILEKNPQHATDEYFDVFEEEANHVFVVTDPFLVNTYSITELAVDVVK